MLLPDTVTAALEERQIRASVLCHFDFLTTPSRVWSGFTDLIAGGYTWRGLGNFGSIDGLSARPDMAAEKITFILSGVWPELVTIAKQSSTEVKGRSCTVFLQFFNENWAKLDGPIAIKSAIMDQLSYEATGPDQRKISLTAESIFAARGAAPFAYYTDRDQNSRSPGDRSLELIPSMIYRQVTWPSN